MSHDRSDDESIVTQLFAVTETLNAAIAEARKHQIEVSVEVDYSTVIDNYRPHTVQVQLKISKILGHR